MVSCVQQNWEFAHQLGFKQRTVWGLNGNSDKHHDFPSQNS